MTNRRFPSILLPPLRRIPTRAWTLAALSLTIRGVWCIREGLQTSPDTWYYVQAADSALSDGLLESLLETPGALKYSSFIALLAGLRAVSGVYFIGVWVLLGVVASAAAVIPLYLLARDLVGPRAALITGILYAACFDIFQWATFALTDTLFLSVAITATYLFHRAHRSGRRKDWFVAAVVGLAVATMRIAGAAYVTAMLLWLASSAANTRWKAAGPRVRQALGVAILVTVAAGFILTIGFVGALTGKDPSMAEYYAAGTVVDDDPHLNFVHNVHPYPEDDFLGYAAQNPEPFGAILFLKLGSFWTVFSQRYSHLHAAVNAVTLLPLIVLGMPTMAYAVFRRRAQEDLWLPIFVVVAMTYFHALTVVDYDFRYRIPVVPFLALYAAIPIERLVSTALRLPAVELKETI